MPTKISKIKLHIPSLPDNDQGLGLPNYRELDRALAYFFEAHNHISDEALLKSGEVVMDADAFYKLRKKFGF